MKRITDFFDKKYVYAIVGASNNPVKYGFKITKELFENGFKVFPINPSETKVYNIKTYASILAVKEKIDIVNFVVPPKVTLKVLEEVKELNIKKVWFQTGSYDQKCIDFCMKNKISYLKDMCIYMETLKYSTESKT